MKNYVVFYLDGEGRSVGNKAGYIVTDSPNPEEAYSLLYPSSTPYQLLLAREISTNSLNEQKKSLSKLLTEINVCLETLNNV